MDKKEKLRNGLANLIGRADSSVSKQRLHNLTEGIVGEQKEQPVTDEAKPEQETEGAAPQMVVEPTTLQDETDLINSIEDEALRKELQERLRRKRMVGRGRPRKNDQLGRRMDGYDRTSLIIPVDKWAKVKEIAFIETLTLKEIVELALDMVIERYESKHGEVKPQPQRQKKDISEIF